MCPGRSPSAPYPSNGTFNLLSVGALTAFPEIKTTTRSLNHLEGRIPPRFEEGRLGLLPESRVFGIIESEASATWECQRPQSKHRRNCVALELLLVFGVTVSCSPLPKETRLLITANRALHEQAGTLLLGLDDCMSSEGTSDLRGLLCALLH